MEEGRRHAERAALASLDGDLPRALSELILASEHYVDGLRDTRDKVARRQLVELFEECAAEAERIKARQRALHSASEHGASSNRPASIVRGPVNIAEFEPEDVRQVPKKEQLILLRSSKVGNLVVPLWDASQVSKHVDTTEVFTDDSSIFENLPVIAGFSRLQDCVPRARIAHDDMVIHTTLRQSVLNDCSLVASLIVASQWSTRFRTRLLLDNLYPQDASGSSIVSRNGKYMLRVHLNGAYRQLVIDDLLPVDVDGNPSRILAFPSNYPQICGPALIQKASLKLAGGEHQGSDSCTDLKLLVNWIPERVALRAKIQDYDALWDRIHKSWISGDVLITCGSGRLTSEEEAYRGVASDHDYAVVNVRSEDDRRLLTLQNPWHMDHASETDREDRATMCYKSVFDMELNQLSTHFATLLLSWNPKLYKYRITKHLSTTADSFGLADDFVHTCPQFIVSNNTDQEVNICVLLCRHRQSSPQVSSTAQIYTCLSVYDNEGQRVVVGKNPVARTDYHGAYEISMCFSMAASKSYTLVVSQRNAASSESMTLTVYHDGLGGPLTLSDPLDVFAHVSTHAARWDGISGGGNPGLQSYVRNPHMLLTCITPTSLLLVLETDAAVDVNLDIHAGHARRVGADVEGSLVKSGSSYRRSVQTLRATLQPGQYAVVPSTYHAHTSIGREGSSPGNVGAGSGIRFRLHILSDVALAPSSTWAVELGSGQFARSLHGHYGGASDTDARFSLSTERANVVTVHVHPTGRRAVRQRVSLVRCDDARAGSSAASASSSSMVVVREAEGWGSLALDRVPLARAPPTRYLLLCRDTSTSGRGAAATADARERGFEVCTFSDSALHVGRV